MSLFGIRALLYSLVCGIIVDFNLVCKCSISYPMHINLNAVVAVIKITHEII